MRGRRPELAEGREDGRDVSRSLAARKRMIIRADRRLEAGCFSRDGGLGTFKRGGRENSLRAGGRGDRKEPVPGKSGADGVPSRTGGREKGTEEEELGVRSRKSKAFLLHSSAKQEGRPFSESGEGKGGSGGFHVCVRWRRCEKAL